MMMTDNDGDGVNDSDGVNDGDDDDGTGIML